MELQDFYVKLLRVKESEKAIEMCRLQTFETVTPVLQLKR